MKIRLIKSIMSGSLFACALVSLVAAVMTSGTARADGNVPTCGVSTLHGSYVFATHGWNIIGGVAQPKAIVEGIDFNGDGTLVSPFATVSVNGLILRFAGGTGSYTVNPDCTGTLTFPAMGITFDIFVDPHGNELWMIQTGPEAVPAVFEGKVTRVSR
jgi:hypothetical protein